MMRVIGIDPGLRNLGWGVIDVDGVRMRHVGNGICHSTASADLATRLLELHRQLTDVLARFAPHTAAVEQTFVNKDAVATLKLGSARGIALFGPRTSWARGGRIRPQCRQESRGRRGQKPPRNKWIIWCGCNFPA